MENQNAIRIRKIEDKDVATLCEICLKTGDSGKDATALYNDHFLLGFYYAFPYGVAGKAFSFVAVDANSDIPLGYILGCDDTLLLNKQRRKMLEGIREYVQANKNNASDSEASLKNTIVHDLNKAGIETCLEETMFSPEDEEYWCKEYPAHLHIDLLPVLQGKGFGHKLMQTFLENLRACGVKGVHLGVGEENQRAIGFYKKEGFSVLSHTSWGYWLGMKL